MASQERLVMIDIELIRLDTPIIIKMELLHKQVDRLIMLPSLLERLLIKNIILVTYVSYIKPSLIFAHLHVRDILYFIHSQLEIK